MYADYLTIKTSNVTIQIYDRANKLHFKW